MVARRDAPAVAQGDNICQVLDGCHDRCIELQLGRKVETIWPLWQTQGRGLRVLATIEGGHEQQCFGALRCQVDGQGQGWPRTLLQLSGAGRDRQQSNLGLHQSFGGPLPLLEQHYLGPLVYVCTYVLLSTHSTRRSPHARQAECASRLSKPLEARSHRHPSQAEGLRDHRPLVRPALSGPLCNLGKQVPQSLCVMAA